MGEEVDDGVVGGGCFVCVPEDSSHACEVTALTSQLFPAVIASQAHNGRSQTGRLRCKQNLKRK